MILQALHELAIAESLLPDPDYELRPITYWIELAADGRFLGFANTRQPIPGQEGKKKPKELPKSFLMPREAVRTSGARAFFLYDKADYIFGREPQAEEGKGRAAADLAERAALFRARVDECLKATSDPALAVVSRFLHQLAAGLAIDLPADCTPNDLFGFQVAGESVVERPAVRAYWKQQRNPEEDLLAQGSKKIRCLVTGRMGDRVKNHLSLKNVPGAVSSGAPFISFNSPAFESYGWSGNHNAPISREAAESYGTALQRLVSPGYPNPNDPNEILDRLNLRLSGDTLVCYWTPQSPFAAQLTGLFEVQLERSADEVRHLYQSIWSGRAVELENPAAFYALVLSGAQGRVVARSFLELTVGEAQKNLAAHFGDIAIVRNTPKPKKNDLPPTFPLRDLLAALGGLGQAEVPAPLAEQFVQAALRGSQYPMPLLQRALLRQRAEIGRADWSDLARRDARAALIKAVLNRRRRLDSTVSYPEVTLMLDPENSQPGYLCGRLMALTERLQQAALGDVNASVVDRFFSAASATPQAVFPRLLKNARHHARKAADGDRSGLAWKLEREIDRVVDRLGAKTGFPPFLSLEDQGFFVLGYHHQRHALFQPREKSPAEADVVSATEVAID